MAAARLIVNISITLLELVIGALITLLVGTGTGGLIGAYVSRANLEATLSNERQKIKAEALAVAREHVDKQWMILTDRLDQRNERQQGQMDRQDTQIERQDKLIDELQSKLRSQEYATFLATKRGDHAQSKVDALQRENERLQRENKALQAQLAALDARANGGDINGH